jgi:pilus assembly protein CpaB
VEIAGAFDKKKRGTEMNKRFVGVLIFAFLVASGASLLLYKVLATRPQVAKPVPVASVRIVLAGRQLEAGSVLKEDDLKLTDWQGAVPAGATGQVQDLVGRGVIATLYAKEPVIESRLAAKGAGGGFAATIPPGMRAVPVRVNEVAGVAGFVVPGMRVDVLISGNSPGGDGRLGTRTKTLLQNVEVLSAGQDFKKDPEGKPVVVQVVNLLVTPPDAERLSLASNQTTIQLVLRNPLDKAEAKTPGTAVKLLFDGGTIAQLKNEDEAHAQRAAAGPAPAVHPAAPKKETAFVMEIISGAKKSEQKFETGGEGK